MDRKSTYAQYIAQAIRKKKASKGDPKEDDDFIVDDTGDGLDDATEEALDPKAARKERLKEILAR
jgi:hypothetical protein